MRDEKGRFVKGHTHSQDIRIKIGKGLKGGFVGEKHYFWGKKHTSESRKKMSESKKGRRTSLKTEFKKGHVFWLGKKNPSARNLPQLFKKGHIPTLKGKQSPKMQWDKNPQFTTGYTQYRNFFIRSGGEPVCKQCGKKGCIARNSIHIHHKDGNKHNNNMKNLQALCSKCHHRLHKSKESV